MVWIVDEEVVLGRELGGAGVLKPLISATLDLVFPPQHLDGSGAAQTIGLPAHVWSQVRFLEDPVCDGCGAPYEYDIQSRCAACLAKPRAFARARAACLYDEHSRELILKYKHADRTDLAPLFTGWIGRAAGELIADSDAVTPVPLHGARLFHRKYNQAAEIARPLARRHGLEFLPDALLRAGGSESQAGKSASGRRRNVQGAFRARTGVDVAGKRILLIDDVMTTGATAESCARALLTAGAAKVNLAVIARVKEAANLSI